MNVVQAQIDQGDRFAFGENWARFLNSVDETRIQRAEESLRAMLKVENLQGLRFLDAGSGSGLFSLAARRLGAQVCSFDFDPRSVACTAELRRRYFGDDGSWGVAQGSVLDDAYLRTLGTFDVVYSWGVLHHTGSMWRAMGNVADLVADGARLFISIYNDQAYISRRWGKVKHAYNNRPWLRPVLLSYGLWHAWGMSTLADFYHLKPFESWRNYREERGMSPWWDVVDWVGGWPFEVAKPEAVFEFYRERGFELRNLITRQGTGCNEFVFQRDIG